MDVCCVPNGPLFVYWAWPCPSDLPIRAISRYPFASSIVIILIADQTEVVEIHGISKHTSTSNTSPHVTNACSETLTRHSKRGHISLVSIPVMIFSSLTMDDLLTTINRKPSWHAMVLESCVLEVPPRHSLQVGHSHSCLIACGRYFG